MTTRTNRPETEQAHLVEGPVPGQGGALDKGSHSPFPVTRGGFEAAAWVGTATRLLWKVVCVCVAVTVAGEPPSPPAPLTARYIKIGDKEVEYHPKFRLIMHTKYFNPHYKPEMQAQCSLINFLVTRDGLEDQLLAAVVAKERPDLEQLKVPRSDVGHGWRGAGRGGDGSGEGRRGVSWRSASLKAPRLLALNCTCSPVAPKM